MNERFLDFDMLALELANGGLIYCLILQWRLLSRILLLLRIVDSSLLPLLYVYFLNGLLQLSLWVSCFQSIVLRGVKGGLNLLQLKLLIGEHLVYILHHLRLRKLLIPERDCLHIQLAALLHVLKRVVLVNVLSLELLLLLSSGLIYVVLGDAHHVLLQNALVQSYLPQGRRVGLGLGFWRERSVIIA